MASSTATSRPAARRCWRWPRRWRRASSQSLLGRISVVIVPRVNRRRRGRRPARAGVGRRPNRDHLLLSQPEVRALHAGRCGRCRPTSCYRPSRIQCRPALDREIRRPAGRRRHDPRGARIPRCPRGLAEIAGRLYRPALEAAILEAGLSSFDYVTTDAGMADKRGVARRHRTGHRAQRLRPARRRLLPDRDARRRHRPAELPAPRRDALSAGQVRARGVRGRTDRIADRHSGRAPRGRRRSHPTWSSRTSSRAGRSTCR